jgi:hypothetical protein
MLLCYAKGMAKVEIVWVYGASAAGKESFIRNVQATNAIQRLFHWQNKRIVVCEESIEWVARFPGDQVAERERQKLGDIIPILAQDSDVVLIKGQDVDLSLGTPLDVRRRLPTAIHHIVFIDVGLDELFQRVIHKPWWDGTIRRAEEEGWLEEQIDRLMDIRNMFVFTTIDGRAIGHYEEEDFQGNFV